MGLLDKLWDDTVAGPVPDNGLHKLRRHHTFSSSAFSSSSSSYLPSSPRSIDGDGFLQVSRSIVLRKCSSQKDRGGGSSSGSSRSASTDATPLTPSSPVASGHGSSFTASGQGWWRKPRTKPVPEAESREVEPDSPATPRSPTAYDWVIISALDR